MIINYFPGIKETLYLYFFAGIYLMVVQYTNKPFECQTPPHFTKDLIHDTEKYCLVNGFVLMKNQTELKSQGKGPQNDTLHIEYEKKVNINSFHEWFPAVLFVLGIVSYVPNVIWFIFLGKDVMNLNETSPRGLSGIKEDFPDKNMLISSEDLANRLFSRLLERETTHSNRFTRYKATIFYMICITLNVVCCFFQMSLFMDYAKAVLFNLGEDEPLVTESETFRTVFPSKINCSMELNEDGVINKYKFECDHYINYIFAIILDLLRYWRVIIGMYYACLIQKYSVISLWESRDIYFLDQYLIDQQIYNDERCEENSHMATVFFDKFIKGDGYFIARYLSATNKRISSEEMFTELLKCYLEHRNRTPERLLAIDV